MEDGRQVKVAEASGDWNLVDGSREPKVPDPSSWPGNKSEKVISIRADLALAKMDRSAAVFKMGGSYFGFEGAHGKVFLTGALFDDARGTPIGDPVEFMTDGKPFLFEVIRKGELIRFLIDGKPVHERPITTKRSGKSA